MPLAVYIAPMKFYSKQGQDIEYRTMVLKALETWEKASEGLVSFHLVEHLLNSQINIDWRRVDRKALGHCTYNFDSVQRLYGADVVGVRHLHVVLIALQIAVRVGVVAGTGFRAVSGFRSDGFR